MPQLRAPQRKSAAPKRSRAPRAKKRVWGRLLINNLKLFIVFLGVGGISFYGVKLWQADSINHYFERVQTPSFLLQNLGFKIRKIILEGPHFVEESEIQKVLHFKEGDSLFSVELWKIKDELEKLPWVRSVLIQRRLPDKIYIRLSEHHPLGIWQKKGNYSLIDDQGGIIPGADIRRFSHLPLMTGEGAPEKAPVFLEQLKTYPELAKRVTEATYLTKRRWDIILDHRLRIKLPEGDVFSALDHLRQLESQGHLNNKEIIMIDLRFKDRTFFYLSEEAYQKREALKKLLKGKRA